MSVWAEELPTTWKGIARERTAYLYNCRSCLPLVQYLNAFILILFWMMVKMNTPRNSYSKVTKLCINFAHLCPVSPFPLLTSSQKNIFLSFIFTWYNSWWCIFSMLVLSMFWTNPKLKHFGDLNCTYRKRPGFHIALLLPSHSLYPATFLYTVWHSPWGVGPLFHTRDPAHTAATWLHMWWCMPVHICPTTGLFLDDHTSPACILLWAWGKRCKLSPNGTKVFP